ncbi:MAG: hypothetical protein ACYSUF_06205 [Planctomycetota bacterium]|jgi:hypothetical protein
MGLRQFIAIIQLRRKQRRAVQDVERAGIEYSTGLGESLEDPIVITEAKYDVAGSAAIFAWLIRQYGTMDVDWRPRTKNALVDEGRHIDHYVVELRSGERKEHYFDITESWGKWPT